MIELSAIFEKALFGRKYLQMHISKKAAYVVMHWEHKTPMAM